MEAWPRHEDKRGARNDGKGCEGWGECNASKGKRISIRPGPFACIFLCKCRLLSCAATSELIVCACAHGRNEHRA